MPQAAAIYSTDAQASPRYEVIAYLDDEGVIRYEPRFKQGNYVAFKRWHKRAMDVRDRLQTGGHRVR